MYFVGKFTLSIGNRLTIGAAAGTDSIGVPICLSASGFKVIPIRISTFSIESNIFPILNQQLLRLSGNPAHCRQEEHQP